MTRIGWRCSMARTSRKEKLISPMTQVVRWNAGMYLRLSVEDMRKKENNSIGTQKMVIEQFLSQKNDINLHKVYQDVNYSGTNFERPAFKELIADIKKGEINCIIVKDLSRFGRNYIETGNYLEKVFPFMGTRFISVNDNYDSLTADSVDTGLLIPLKNIMHEVYARDISKKVRSQYELKRKRGEFCGSYAPYGYIKIGNTLKVDESAAAVVRKIFKWILEGKSDHAIVQKLNAEGIPSPSKYRYDNGIVKAEKFENCKYWYRSVIKRIAENQVYIGRMAQGRYRTAMFQPNHKPLHLPENEWVIVEHTHPQIIDEESFYKVQEIRKVRKEKYREMLKYSNRPQSDENMFQGIIVCGNCGGSVIRHKSVRGNGMMDYIFLCNLYEEVDKRACKKLYFPERQIIECVKAAVEAQLTLFYEMKDLVEQYMKSPQIKDTLSIYSVDMEQLQSKIQQIEKLKIGLQADYNDGVITKGDFEFFEQEYQQDILKTEHKIQEINSKAEAHKLESNQWLKETGKFIDMQFGTGLIKHMIKKLELFPNKALKITFNYQDDFEELLGLLEQEAKNVEV